MKIDRVVTLPHWQGYGIGMRMAEKIIEDVYMDQDVRITTTLPIMHTYLFNSFPKWRLTFQGVPSKLGKSSTRNKQPRTVYMETYQYMTPLAKEEGTISRTNCPPEKRKSYDNQHIKSKVVENTISEKTNIYIADVEVFARDWVVVMLNVDTDEWEIFVNDAPQLADFMTTRPFTGWFNGKHYDQFIIRAILSGASHTELKEINDYIINDGEQGWSHPLIRENWTEMQLFDLKDDLPLSLSLKAIEGNMGIPIRESSIPFDYPHKLNEKQLKEVIEYCQYDVKATKELYLQRQGYLKGKIAVGEMAHLGPEESMYMTNAKLVASLLAGPYAKPREWGDDTVYEFPDNLRVENQEVLEFFSVIDPTYKSSKKVMIAGVEHTLAYGGLHGAQSNFINDPNKLTMNVDVRSYYPSLMIEYDYFSRAIKDKQLFVDIYNARIHYKEIGDKEKQQPLKLVLNTTYGTMKNKYNALYDPRMANAVCISGQLFLIDLIEKLAKIRSVELVQSNTDGIMIQFDQSQLENVRLEIKKWEKRTRFVMEEDHISKVVQKDVNNYLIQDKESGKLKVKGGWLTTHNGQTILNGDLTIVAKAIVNYLVYGTPVEETINSSTNVLDFQMIAKTGRTYEKTVHARAIGTETHTEKYTHMSYVEEKDVTRDILDMNNWVEVQRVNRVYASKDKSYGTLYKVKSSGRRDKIATIPEHAIIDNENKVSLDMIDKMWYNVLASQRLRDFVGERGGEQINMKNVLKIATKKTYLYQMNGSTVETLLLEKGEPYPEAWTEATVITKREFDKYNKENEKQKEDTTLSEVKKEVTKEQEIQHIPLTRKIFNLMTYLNQCDWTPDGVNERQEYKYITAKKYKRNLLDGCLKNDLLFTVDIYDVAFKQNITSKLHLTTLTGTVTLTDSLTGESKTYHVMGDGADMGDSGMYKAQTGIIKYFVANNFLVGESLEVEDDGSPQPKVDLKQDKPPKANYTSLKEREVIKEKLMTTEDAPKDSDIASLRELRQTMIGAGFNKEVEHIDTVMKSRPTQNQVMELIIQAEELLLNAGLI